MAVALHSLVLFWGPDFDSGAWGASTLTDLGVVSVKRAAPTHLGEYESGVRLAKGKLTGTYATYARRLGAWASWGPTQVIGDVLAGVSCRITPSLGGTPYYWNGTAWAAATTQWTSLADLYAHLPAWTNASLGFVFKLARTLATDASPVLCGAQTVARVMFAQSSGDPDRASSWEDDLVRRIIIPAAEAVLSVSGSQEFVASTETGPKDRDPLHYAGGLPEFPYNILGVDAVYDTTADVHLQSPVAGAWDAAARTWTPTVAWTIGHRYHVRFRFAPWVEANADPEYFADKLPAVVFETVTPQRRRPTSGWVSVASATDVVSVRAPTSIDGQASCRILASRATDRDRIWQVMEQWLERGVELVSPSTSLSVSLQLLADDGPTPVLGGGAARHFTVEASWDEWPGEETTNTVLQPGGFAPEFNSQGG